MAPSLTTPGSMRNRRLDAFVGEPLATGGEGLAAHGLGGDCPEGMAGHAHPRQVQAAVKFVACLILPDCELIEDGRHILDPEEEIPG